LRLFRYLLSGKDTKKREKEKIKKKNNTHPDPPEGTLIPTPTLPKGGGRKPLP
jgi:hypothetical protein